MIMFGGLKKRLKEAVEKVSKSITKEEKQSEPQQEIKQEQILEEPEHKQEHAEPSIESGHAPDSDTAFEDQLDNRIEELEELKEKVQEEKLPPEIAESKIETETVSREEKRSIFGKITEKKLTGSEIENILKELNIALLENDVAVEVADKICGDVKNGLVDTVVKRGKVDDTIKLALRRAMMSVMEQDKIDLDSLISSSKGPFTIMMIGRSEER